MHAPVDSSHLRVFIWGSGMCDLPVRRHAQASRPDHQGRSMLSYIPYFIRQIGSIFRLGSRADRSTAARIDARALSRLVGVMWGKDREPDFTWGGSVVDSGDRVKQRNQSLRSSTMKRIIWAVVGIGVCLLAFRFGPFIPAYAQDAEWQKVDETLGRKPAVSDDVRRYGFPRSDLSVKLDGVSIKPALALGGWVAFKPAHGGAMIMGDLVLLETEINPVMAKMIASGLEITAVHNHLLRASPATFYMHVAGQGDPVKLASAIHDALAESKTPLTVTAPASPPPVIDLDTAKLDQIIGVNGKANGGVYQFNVKRRDPITEDGMLLTPVAAMGVAIAINFQPTGAGKAAITGDFVLTSDEVNPVILALRTYGIEVTALHSHMLDEQPRLFFMHFWANDDAVKLAEGLRAALDKTASTKG
ncbi:hypothetical protein ABIB68_002423 [Bradyrhizobium sp. F1.2.2]